MNSQKDRMDRHLPYVAVIVLAMSALAAPVTSMASATWVVNTCSDTNSGNATQHVGGLRFVVSKASASDTIDLGQLPFSCAITNTITLKSGPIVVLQSALNFVGSPTTRVSISGNHLDRVFEHYGQGLLRFQALSIIEGSVVSEGASTEAVAGGCIRSEGDVLLDHSTVNGCQVHGSRNAAGGGISAKGAVTLSYTTISDNEAFGAIGEGGGVASYNGFVADNCLVSNNRSSTLGGGVMSIALGRAEVHVSSSTIESNHTEGSAGGLFFDTDYPLTIVNTTISQNSAWISGGGIYLTNGAKISNSTIAFNKATSQTGTGGGIFQCCDTAALDLQSSVVATNRKNFDLDLDDIALSINSSLSGKDNLILVSDSPLPPGTISMDPVLGPLNDNGGATPTHALLSGSPAIGVGNNVGKLRDDQRGRGFPRALNGVVDIGAVQYNGRGAHK